MEKIIFFGLVIPIFAFVLYLGGNAIMKGMSAKNADKENKNLENNENENYSEKNQNLGEELDKLNNLLKEGVLTQEEFEKAKKKILDN
ncbi:SHOCT domain-containing protein [Pelagibacterales bacterium SAG-MED19]|nr:SHOCT domain-containing protein [Pelagibacterales bacterium SAG-MED19]